MNACGLQRLGHGPTKRSWNSNSECADMPCSCHAPVQIMRLPPGPDCPWTAPPTHQHPLLKRYKVPSSKRSLAQYLTDPSQPEISNRGFIRKTQQRMEEFNRPIKSSSTRSAAKQRQMRVDCCIGVLVLKEKQKRRNKNTSHFPVFGFVLAEGGPKNEP